MKDGLIFDWPGRHHLHLLLPAAILVALALHIALFFVFSIVYPRQAKAGPDPVQVYFLSPTSPDFPRIQALIASEDPAVFAPGRGLQIPDGIPPVTHSAQYRSAVPALEPLPPPPQAASTDTMGPVPIPPSPRHSTPTLAPPTSLFAPQPLANRLPPLPQGTQFRIPQKFEPEPVSFLICVGADGTVLYRFPQHSSGNPDLDLQASSLLRALKFRPATTTEWGLVTFQWGKDLQYDPH